MSEHFPPKSQMLPISVNLKKFRNVISTENIHCSLPFRIEYFTVM